jgi:asparagine synthase (glutamine-hydrolysing)
MGFPVPLKEWFSGPLSGFVQEIFQDMKSSDRQFINADAVLKNFENTGQFSRKAWALLSLELWQQEFHDKASSYRAMLK